MLASTERVVAKIALPQSPGRRMRRSSNPVGIRLPPLALEIEVRLLLLWIELAVFGPLESNAGRLSVRKSIVTLYGTSRFFPCSRNLTAAAAR